MVGMASNKSTAPSQVSKTIDTFSDTTVDLESSSLQVVIECNKDSIAGSDATKRQKRQKRQNDPKSNDASMQPVEKKRKGNDDNDSDDDVEILRRVIEKSREKREKQKTMHYEEIVSLEQKIKAIVKEHTMEIEDLEKDFHEATEVYEQKIMEKDKEKTDLERRIVQLEAKLKENVEERKTNYCYECGEATSALVFCNKKCTENHIK